MKIQVLAPIYRCKLCGRYIINTSLTPVPYIDNIGNITNHAPDTINHQCGTDSILIADIDGFNPLDEVHGICELIGYKNK